jgi:hypothetical protein
MTDAIVAIRNLTLLGLKPAMLYWLLSLVVQIHLHLHLQFSQSRMYVRLQQLL